MGLLATLALILATPWLGSALAGEARNPAEPPEVSALFAGLGGFLALFLGALALDLLGIPWSRASLLGLLTVLALLAWRGRRQDQRFGGLAAIRLTPLLQSWGASIAILALGVYAAATLLQLNLHSDFLYHWGVKGHRFALAQGIDAAFLSAPSNLHLHPDYPLMVPSLYAITATLAGTFDPRSMGLWSALAFALCLMAWHGSWTLRGLTRAARQPALAGLALLGMMFGIGYQLAGGADWMLCLAVAAALIPLTAEQPGPATDRQVALIAAFAAASKIEGVVLAALLLSLHCVRRLRSLPKERQGRALGLALWRSAWLPALVIGLWAMLCLRYGWWNDSRQSVSATAEMLDRLPRIAEALWQSLWTVNWHGLPLLLAALPAFLWSRRWRPVAMLLLAQLGFYLVVYITTPLDAVHLIQTSAARLYFHVLPTAMALLFAALLAPAQDSGRLPEPFEDPVRQPLERA